MAELVLAIKDMKEPTSYRKYDIVDQFNNRRIGAAWADSLTKTHKSGFNSDGLRIVGGMSQLKQEIIMQYRISRVSLNEVNRVELATGKSEIISNKQNKKGEFIFVGEFLSRATKDPNHKIFGNTGSEFWYGGHTDVSHEKVDSVWSMIEVKSKLRRVEYLNAPLGVRDVKGFLSLKFKNFTDIEGKAFVAPEFEPDLTIPDKPATRIKQKRINIVNWEEEVGISGPTIDDIKDLTKPIDLRDKPDNLLTLVKSR